MKQALRGGFAMEPGQRGGFAMGMVAGLLVGLALALGVALYITKAPVPFVDKLPARTAEQDTAETERNRSWDPNAPLGGRAARPGAAGSGTAAVPGTAATSPPPTAGLPPGIAPVAPADVEPRTSPSADARTARDPAAILGGGGLPAGAPAAAPPLAAALPATPSVPRPAATSGGDAFMYFVQAGAYARNEEAEQQRARLAMMGQAARITEREQAGRTVYRVRLGPYASRDEADGQQSRLQDQSIEAQIVRVARP